MLDQPSPAQGAGQAGLLSVATTDHLRKVFGSTPGAEETSDKEDLSARMMDQGTGTGGGGSKRGQQVQDGRGRGRAAEQQQLMRVLQQASPVPCAVLLLYAAEKGDAA